MVRLELTLAEAQQLQHWLAATYPCPSAPTLVTKLAEAIDHATQRKQCPICQHWFTHENSGRNGRYCGAACKQKAYRQRRLDARKQFRLSVQP